MKFTLKLYERLIELVRNHPVLYDASKPDYKDHLHQRDVWKKIAREMNADDMTWEDWKKVWKYKRDAFAKKKREIQLCPHGRKVSKGPLYDKMAFLADHLSGRSAAINLDNVKVCLSEEESCKSKKEADEEEDGDAEATDELEFPRATTSTATLEPLSLVTYTDNSKQLATVSVVREESAAESAPRSTFNTTRRKLSADTGKRVSQSLIRKSKRDSDLKLASLIEQLKEHASSHEEGTRKLVLRVCEEDDDTNVLTFLAKKMSTFSDLTQQWIEDEVLKIYIEAKKRDRNLRTTTNVTHFEGSTSFQQYQPTSLEQFYVQQNQVQAELS